MSLINEMLRDLEARREPAGSKSLPGEVRALPQVRTSVRPKVFALVAVLAAAVAAWWGYRILAPVPVPAGPHAPAVQAAAPASQPLESSAVAPPAGTAAPAAVPVPEAHATPGLPAAGETVPLPSQETGEDPAAEAIAPSAAPPEKNVPAAQGKRERAGAPASGEARGPVPSELKIATELSLANTHAAPVGTANPKPADPSTGQARAPAPAPARLATQADAEGEPVIEKQMRTLTPREQADSEYRKAMASGGGRSAEAGLRAALRHDASHTPARLALANVLIGQARLEEAQLLLQEGLARHPGQPAVALQLARIQVERGDLPGAEATLARHEAAGAGSADYRAFHAGVLQRLGAHGRAADEYRAALRISPRSGVWWMGLGLSLEAEGHSVQAREAYTRARAAGDLSADLDRYVEQRLGRLP